jgi:hypothetical protein
MNVQLPTEGIQAALNNVLRVVFDMKQIMLVETLEHLQDRMEDRIFQQGKRTDNKIIGTGSMFKHKDGSAGTKYNPQYAEKRKKEGLQIGFIDFKRTGELKRSIKIIRLSDGRAALGIADGWNADKADKLEKMKGETFKPTKAEIRNAVATLKQIVKRESKNFRNRI